VSKAVGARSERGKSVMGFSRIRHTFPRRPSSPRTMDNDFNSGRSSDLQAIRQGGVPTWRCFPGLWPSALRALIASSCAVRSCLPLRGSSGFAPDSLLAQRKQFSANRRAHYSPLRPWAQQPARQRRKGTGSISSQWPGVFNSNGALEIVPVPGLEGPRRGLAPFPASGLAYSTATLHWKWCLFPASSVAFCLKSSP
jgi:hypothetical protein